MTESLLLLSKILPSANSSLHNQHKSLFAKGRTTDSSEPLSLPPSLGRNVVYCSNRRTPYLVSSYHEQSPWEMDPPPYGLSPPSLQLVTAVDTPELLAAALAIAHKIGINIYGFKPIHLWDAHLLLKDYPLVDYRSPPPLREVTLPEDVEFIEQLYKRGHASVHSSDGRRDASYQDST